MKNLRIQRLFAFFLCLGIVSLSLLGCGSKETTGESSNGEATAAEKETITIRIGAGHTPEGTTWVRMVKNYFIPEVDKALENTNYKIEWVEAYGGQVAKLGEELNAVENNLLDIGFVNNPFDPVRLKISNIGYHTPFSSSDPTVIATVAEGLLEKYPEFKGEYDKANQKLLGLGFTESYDLITNFPVTSVEDLKGRKIGAAGPNLAWIKPLGAVPVQAGLSDVYQGLQSGMIDGYVTFSFSALGYKFYEQAKYFTRVGLGSVIVGGLTINNDKWNTLPKEVQDVIEEVGGSYTMAIAEELKKETEANLQKMQELGATVSSLSESEKAVWIDTLPNMPNEYAQKLNAENLPGSEMLKDYIQGQIDAGYKFPKEYTID